MIKLPKNMTNEEYMTLTKEERAYISLNLPNNNWLYFNEVNPRINKPKLPCVIESVLIGE